MPLRFPASLSLVFLTALSSCTLAYVGADSGATTAAAGIPVDWLGSYHGSDDDVTIAPDATFVYATTCQENPLNGFPFPGTARGDIRMRDGWMVFTVRSSEGRCAFQPSYRFMVGSVGKRHVVLAPADLQEFVNFINAGGTGNAYGKMMRGPGVDMGHGAPHVDIDRTFAFPDEYRERLLDSPFEADVVEIGPATEEVHQPAGPGVRAQDGIRHVARVRLDRGTAGGLHEGTWLISDAGFFEVSRATTYYAEADITWWSPAPGPHVGTPMFSTNWIEVQDEDAPPPAHRSLGSCKDFGGTLVRNVARSNYRWACHGAR